MAEKDGKRGFKFNDMFKKVSDGFSSVKKGLKIDKAFEEVGKTFNGIGKDFEEMFSGETYSETHQFVVAPQQDFPIIHQLPISLEDISKGVTKKMKITRKILNPDGLSTGAEERILTIDIKPGWKAGTKIKFDRLGDQAPDRIPADIVFQIADKPHPLFKRDGADIHYTMALPVQDALCGTTIRIPTLDGHLIPMEINEVIKPTTVKRLPNFGLPYWKEPQRRGDLVVHFEITYPDNLPRDVKEVVRDCFKTA